MSSSSFGNEMPYNEFLSKNNSFKLQNERFKAFKEQDTEKGHFDVTFEIEGKMLHANKVFLTPVSERFDAWLSDRWTTKDNPVKVEDASYDNFYQFLCFIYSGFCKINRGNAFQLTDMAESYGVACFKEFCDGALSKMKINVEDIEEMYEHADLYTLPRLTNSIKIYALFHGDDISRDENFLAFKKPFVQFLSTLPREPDYENHSASLKYRKESEFFESVYKWAERQVQNKAATSDDAFDLQEAIKAELKTIIPRPKFCYMNYEFLLNFVVEKGFFLSAVEFNQFFQEYQAGNTSVNQNAIFRNVYELAQKQAVQKLKISSDPDNFNLADCIKADLVETIPHVKFYMMSKEFLMDFVVEKCGINFSATELSKIYQNPYATEDERFRRVYHLAKKLALDKQQKSPVDNFNLLVSIKTDLAETIPHVKFYEMSEEFLMNFVVEKCGFTFSSTELSQFYQSLRRISVTEENRFERIYRLTEKQALIKQQKAPVDNFDLAGTIKIDLVEVIPFIEFSKMDKSFLIDFVVEKGFILSPTTLSKFHRKSTGAEHERFKQVYELAEKQGLKKQMMSSDGDNFNLAETIKTDMAEVIPQINFCHMDKRFFNNFVVGKGLITEEQAIHLYDIHFEVENNGHRIRGTIEDNADICSFIGREESCAVKRNNIITAKRRFLGFDLPVPKTPSSLQKMVGCEWYLCFEKDKVVTLKHHLLVKKSDYLIAEMKGDTDFELGLDGLTTLTAKCHNI